MKHRAVIITGDRHAKPEVWGSVVGGAILATDPYANDVQFLHGGASGIDTIASDFLAIFPDYRVHSYPANWYPLGPSGPLDRSAGPRRNQEMLNHLLNLRDDGYKCAVLAFHDNLWRGSRGTRNMAVIAKQAGIPVIEFTSKTRIELV